MSNNELDDQVIRDQLEKIAKSPMFLNSGAKIDFLTYVVKETLAGRAEHIKAYNVAVDGLGISENFDPQKDSRIRVLASRLRQSLSSYYRGDGAADPVIIDLPKGRYLPFFSHNTSAALPLTDRASWGDGLRVMVWPLNYAQKGGLAGAISHNISASAI